MRIRAAEVIPYALPFREPYVTARGSLERREMALLRLRTDAGLEGLGEAVPLALRGGAGLGEVVGALSRAAEALIGAQAAEATALGPRAAARAELPAPARAALEVAVLDLQAKAAGVPLWRHLGAPEHAPVAVNATLTAGDPGSVAAQAERWAELGFTAFKLKAGLAGDVAALEAVRAALGREARLRVDANGAWSREEAILKLGAMERFGVELAEQPAADLEDMRLVRAATAVPLAADESVATVAEAERAAELGACDLVAVKLAKVGGVAPALAIAATLPSYLSSALDGPVGIAAAAHAAQVLRGRGDAGVAHGLATQALFSATIAERECALGRGELAPPEGPGLGVELDERALARQRL